jgi:hypothetical protein
VAGRPAVSIKGSMKKPGRKLLLCQYECPTLAFVLCKMLTWGKLGKCIEMSLYYFSQFYVNLQVFQSEAF